MIIMKTIDYNKFLKVFFVLLLFSFIGYSQITRPFVRRYENTGINGDLTIIGNNLLSNNPVIIIQ